MFLDVNGNLTQLRLDPGSDQGQADVAWIELQQASPYPLVIERMTTTPASVALKLRNRSRGPLDVAFGRQTKTLGAEATAEMACKLEGSGPFEAVEVSVGVKGCPPLRRTIVVHRPLPADDWPTCRSGPLTLRVAPDGSGARIEREGKLAAVVAPWVMADGAVRKFRPVREKENVLRLAGDGSEVTVTLRGDEIEVAIRSPGPVEGPVVRPIGPLEQGLFAGLEYLGKGETSSSKLDIETADHLRFAPDPLLVTLPLVACVTDRASVAMTWSDTSLGPTLACPNFVDGMSGEHRMSLRGRKIDAVIRVAASSRTDRQPVPPRGATTGGPLEDAIVWAVRRHGLPPLPTAPRDAKRQAELALAAFRGPIAGPGGWGHCAEPSWRRQPFADVASTIWRLTGEAPPMERIVAGGGHVRNDAIYFVTGRTADWLDLRRREARGLIASQQPDGSYRYQGPFRRGHDEDTASGYCAPSAVRLLEFARATGDRESLAAGLRTLEYMKRFREPRGAQTWELSLHTPDVLASAYLVWAYVRGYELTGRAEYLGLARRWAVSGMPFVYLWQRYPIMLYATVPVYGATNYRSPLWIGLPVQWCGGVYAYALAMLAPHDDTLDWRHVARGILIAGQQMQYPDGPRVGCLPDVFKLPSQGRDGPSINPSGLECLRLVLDGKLDGLAVAANERHRVCAPFPVTLDKGHALIQAASGAGYQVLIDGRVIERPQVAGRRQAAVGVAPYRSTAGLLQSRVFREPWSSTMTAIVLDGRALAEQIRGEAAQQAAEFIRTDRRRALPGRRAGRRESGQRGLRPQQAEGVREGRHRQPTAPAAGRHLDRRLLALVDRLNRDRGGPRHPGPVAAAEGDRRDADPGGRQPAEGRRCLSSGERRAGSSRAGRDSCPARRTASSNCCCAARSRSPGRTWSIVGRSDIVGKPMAIMLMQRGPGGDATVTVCHSRTREPARRHAARPTSSSWPSAGRSSSRPTWSSPARW